MRDAISVQQKRAYKSFDEYVEHFYGKNDLGSIARIEAAFGKRLAQRVLEVEATEQKKQAAASPAS